MKSTTAKIYRTAISRRDLRFAFPQEYTLPPLPVIVIIDAIHELKEFETMNRTMPNQLHQLHHHHKQR